VEVQVSARDGKGPVADLSREDFILLDRGKPCEIRAFSVIRSSPDTRPLQPLPANNFSNALQHKPNRPASVTVILLDALNTPVRLQAFARRQVTGWLRQITPDQTIAVYFLGKSLHVLHDFSSDPTSLIRMLSAFRGQSVAEVEASQPQRSNSGDPTLDQILDQLNERAAEYAIATRARTTLASLEAIASRLGEIPGRKNLIWISSGFPFSIGLDRQSFGRNVGEWRDRRTFDQQIERTARLLNQANVSIYPVDAGGLQQAGNFKEASVSGSPAWTPDSRREADAIQNARTTMRELAERTGGQAYHDGNDLKRAIREALLQSELTYTLGFYPDAASLDGRFHEFEVKTRRKGVRLRHRKGYFALPELPPLGDEDVRERFLETMASPLESTEILLTLRLERNPDGSLNARLNARPSARRVETLAIPSVVFDVLIAQQAETGAVLDVLRDTARLDDARRLPAEGVTVGAVIRPKEGAATVRAIVLDRASGAVGSLIVPLSQLR
jgi:VWFA-related protein